MGKAIVLFLLIVSAPPLVYAADEDALQAELTTDRPVARIGEQIRIRLLISAPVSAFSITHDPVSVSSGKLVPLSRRKYQRGEGEQARQYLDSSWALFATTETDIDLTGVTVRATLPVSASGASGSTNPKVKVTTKGVTLQIQPTDAQFTPWLAATAVKLDASWPDGTDNLRAGVPIKRHIHVVASDQLPAAIPPLKFASTETLRTYPGIPELQLDKTPEGVTGTRLETMTLIPAAAGNITLPAVQLDWWNTGTGQWERSTLPAQQISVGQGAMLTPATQASLYQYATALLALVCVLLAVALWRVSRKAGNQSAVTTVTQFQAPVTETDLWQALQHAARQNNYTAFRINLKRWLKKHRTTVENLGSLDAGVLDELQQIDRIRFGAVNPTGTTVSAKQQLGSVLPGLKRLRKRLRTDTDERLPGSRGQRVRQKLYPD